MLGIGCKGGGARLQGERGMGAGGRGRDAKHRWLGFQEIVEWSGGGMERGWSRIEMG